MHSWKEEKQRAEKSLKHINDVCYTNAMNGSHDWCYKLEIRLSGAKRLWKTIYDSGSNISEGFRTWREVAIFLSGMRKALRI